MEDRRVHLLRVGLAQGIVPDAPVGGVRGCRDGPDACDGMLGSFLVIQCGCTTTGPRPIVERSYVSSTTGTPTGAECRATAAGTVI